MTIEEIQQSIDRGDTRKCNKCNTTLPVTDFFIKVDKIHNKYCRFGSPCKSCSNIQRQKNYSKEYHRKLKYGISDEDYSKMLKQQKYCCGICGIHRDDVSKDFAVDHNHNTGKIRGLLCGGCNGGIGMLKDSIKVLKRAIAYLEKYNK